MAGRIVGAPAPKPGPRIEVLRVVTPTWQTFVILSTAPFGKRIHWYGGRSHECTGKDLETSTVCHGCQNEWPSKWKGYLDVIQLPSQKRSFLEITPTVWEMIDSLVFKEDTLRGLMIKVKKTPGGRYGRYEIELLERKAPIEQLPRESDPTQILEFLWRCKNRYGQQSKQG